MAATLLGIFVGPNTSTAAPGQAPGGRRNRKFHSERYASHAYTCAWRWRQRDSYPAVRARALRISLFLSVTSSRQTRFYEFLSARKLYLAHPKGCLQCHCYCVWRRREGRLQQGAERFWILRPGRREQSQGIIRVRPCGVIHITVGKCGPGLFSPVLPALPGVAGTDSSLRFGKSLSRPEAVKGGPITGGNAKGGTCSSNLHHPYMVNGQDGGEFSGGSASGGGNGGLGVTDIGIFVGPNTTTSAQGQSPGGGGGIGNSLPNDLGALSPRLVLELPGPYCYSFGNQAYSPFLAEFSHKICERRK